MTIVLNATTGISTPPVTVLGNTSGSISIVAPAVAGTNTQTLVATTGTLAPIVSGTSVSATGTSVNFTDIPSWVKRVTVMFSGVSTNGTAIKQIQLGSGSVVITGYLSGTSILAGTVASQNVTTGIGLYSIAAADNLSGSIIISNITGNTWVASGTLAITGATNISVVSSGSIALSGALDRIRIIGSATGNPADTFDAGTINVLYE